MDTDTYAYPHLVLLGTFKTRCRKLFPSSSPSALCSDCPSRVPDTIGAPRRTPLLSPPPFYRDPSSPVDPSLSAPSRTPPTPATVSLVSHTVGERGA
eukprot:1388715-Rhodomonas_salina.2